MRSNKSTANHPEDEIYYIFIPECAYKDRKGNLEDITFNILRSRTHRVFSEFFFQNSYEFFRDKANKSNEKIKSRNKIINEQLLTYFIKLYPEAAGEKLPPYVKVEIIDRHSELSLAGGQSIQFEKPEQFVTRIETSPNFEHLNRIHDLPTDSDDNTNLRGDGSRELNINSGDQEFNQEAKKTETCTSGSMDDANNVKDLIPDNNLFYYESIHWLNQNELFKKLFLLHSAKHELNLWSGRRLLNYSLRANAFPLNKKGKFAARVNQLFSGANDFLNGVWPATFSFLLFHDFWKYHIEEIEPYDTKGWEWWTGLAEHSDAWTSYWGDDTPHHYLSFWAWPIAVTGCLLVTMTNRLLKGRHFADPLTDEAINSLSASLNSQTINFLNDSINFLSYSTFQTHFERAVYAVKWDKNLSHTDRKELLQGIIYVATNHTSITQLQAIAALGDIARTYNQASAKLVKYGTEQQPLDPSSITRDVDNHTLSENYDDLETTALTALEQLMHFDGSKPPAHALTAFYAQQVLWKQGYKIDRIMQAFLFITVLVLLGGAKWFSKIRLAMMLGIKAVTFSFYFSDKSTCESHGLDYNYVSEWARYVCELCPDWDFVRLGQRNNTQTCLDGLMTQSPDIILHKIDRLLKHSNWSTLPLDNLTDWNRDQISEFLEKIADAIKTLDTLDLSDKQESLPSLSTEEIDLLIEFLNKVNVNSLDLSNQLLGPDKITRLFAALINSPKQINLNNNALGAEGAAIVSEFINRSTYPITHINVANNNIPDKELSRLIIRAQNRSISHINFSNNFAGQQTLDALAAGINNGSFQSIDAAHCDFSELDLTIVWQALSNSTQMQTLALDNTGLIDSQFRKARDYFPNFSLTNLSLSNAELGKRGINYLFSGLKENKSIKQLSLNGIRLTSDELTIIANALNQTAITSLSLDNCEITTEDFINWLQALPDDCVLEQLILSNNFLTDEAILVLSHEMTSEKLKLNFLDLSNTKITDESGVQLARASTNVTTLILTDNLLNDGTAIALSKVLPVSRLKTLILRQNYIRSKGAAEMGAALPHSQLAILDLSNNPAGEGMRAIAENLVTEVSYLKQDGDKHLSIDAKRALYKAQPNTQLKEADFSNTTLSNKDAREMCRVLSRAGIDDVTLSPNPTVTAVDLKTCATSSASVLQPFSFFSASNQVEVEYQYLDEEDYQAYMPQETEKEAEVTSEIFISEQMINRYQFYSLMRDENMRPLSENRLLFLPSSHTRGESSPALFAPLLLILPAAAITFLLLYLVYRACLSIRTERQDKAATEIILPKQKR